MALTPLQRDVCRLIAANRIAGGESYVAGGAALNELLLAPRLSQDLDLFHDTEEALEATWQADRQLLEGAGFEVGVLRERPSFIEASVERNRETVRMQWVRDSAYRFFPLLQHEDFGLTLHPFDLATNKVLAFIGRLEVRDWVDVIECDRRIQPLGYLAWAACGKDPGFSPAAILQHAARTARYSAAEVAALAFSGDPPDAAELSRQWHAALEAARLVVDRLPPDRVGHCVLSADGRPYQGDPGALAEAVAQGALVFHSGAIRGALPRVLEEP